MLNQPCNNSDSKKNFLKKKKNPGEMGSESCSSEYQASELVLDEDNANKKYFETNKFGHQNVTSKSKLNHDG